MTKTRTLTRLAIVNRGEAAMRCIRAVKTLRTQQIEEMGGRPVASVIRMGKEEAPDEWTEVHTLSVDFDVELPENLFTLSNLRNPRE